VPGEGLGWGGRAGAMRAPREGEEREGGRREELTTGLTDDNNRSPGSTLGQGERWGDVEEGEGGYSAGKR
jgi:hypothetical protein